MGAPNVIAVVFDFDSTLTDDSTTALLESCGIDTKTFWGVENKALVDAGWDPTLSYLRLILDNVGPNKGLGCLSNEGLREFGKSLRFYEGIPELFSDLKAIPADHKVSRPAVECYVISGGLEEVIRGSSVAEHLDGFWGCQFAEGDDGCIEHVKRTITFTEKTRYLFEVNKGLNTGQAREPYGVNREVAKHDRRVPLKNMIYVGDGLTDVPCFSIINGAGGLSFGVFDSEAKDSPRKAWETLIAPSRTRTLNLPRYGPTDGLGAILRAAVKNLCTKMDLNTQSPFFRDA